MIYDVLHLGRRHGSTHDPELAMDTTPPKMTRVDVNVSQLTG